ncbi:putative uncharacterized protein DDB_G0286901 [Protopterus annectens]|uniref:putative uncharacterized protein DDB_G0286901 n=1 Tax=Protopterus annectens TaxID=7888 RepID=UPI001CF9E940|nr:putative uncharacterized protein DDB_G0286901 [Protopterus annectens]
MANGTGAASPNLFSQEAILTESQDNVIGNLTALVQVLLGRVDSLTQKVEASGFNRIHQTNGLLSRPGEANSGCINNSTPGEAAGISPNHARPREVATSPVNITQAGNNNFLDNSNSVALNNTEGNANLAVPLPHNDVLGQEALLPSMASFLNKRNFFGTMNDSNIQTDSNNEQPGNILSNSINEFDLKLYKCRKLQLEVAYLEECIGKKIIPKGLRQWRYPAGLVENSTFHRELIDLFDRQGLEFLKSLINFYNTDIGNLKSDLESLEHVIKSHKDFPRYKYEYCRVFTSIEATMDKLLITKKRKIARDLKDYSNNKAYPKPPPLASTASLNNTVTYNDNDNDNRSEIIQVPSHSTFSNENEEVQPLRRSERLINNNNNSDSRANNANSNNNQNRLSNNNANVNDGQNQRGFRSNTNAQQTNRQNNRNQPQTRNKRRQRRR